MPEQGSLMKHEKWELGIGNGEWRMGNGEHV